MILCDYINECVFILRGSSDKAATVSFITKECASAFLSHCCVYMNHLRRQLLYLEMLSFGMRSLSGRIAAHTKTISRCAVQKQAYFLFVSAAKICRRTLHGNLFRCRLVTSSFLCCLRGFKRTDLAECSGKTNVNDYSGGKLLLFWKTCYAYALRVCCNLLSL